MQVRHRVGIAPRLRVAHRPAAGLGGGVIAWTRKYTYAADSNRLFSTSSPNPNDAPARYEYDAHGTVTSMPHLSRMVWNDKEELTEVDLGGGGVARYRYDASGQRVRKVVQKQGVVEERIYLGDFEVYRRRRGDELEVERETLHVMDDQDRVALIETQTAGTVGMTGATRERYQVSNHLGSSALEVNGDGAIISFEDYHPYGTAAFRWASGEVSAKRYRYTGKERDEETGFTYNVARYYAPWLGRWTAADPAGFVDGPNLYRYVRNRPVTLLDETGKAPTEAQMYEKYRKMFDSYQHTQLTREREGNSNKTLTVHFPGKSSGPTIGFGHDVGTIGRKERAAGDTEGVAKAQAAEKDRLVGAGMTEAGADALSQLVGYKNSELSAEQRASVSSIAISPAVRDRLLEADWPNYERRARDRATVGPFAISEAKWKDLDKFTKELVTDLTYVGAPYSGRTPDHELTMTDRHGVAQTQTTRDHVNDILGDDGLDAVGRLSALRAFVDQLALRLPGVGGQAEAACLDRRPNCGASGECIARPGAIYAEPRDSRNKTERSQTLKTVLFTCASLLSGCGASVPEYATAGTNAQRELVGTYVGEPTACGNEPQMTPCGSLVIREGFTELIVSVTIVEEGGRSCGVTGPAAMVAPHLLRVTTEQCTLLVEVRGRDARVIDDSYVRVPTSSPEGNEPCTDVHFCGAGITLLGAEFHKL